MSLNAYGHKQTNQILDFDERHCINEYKSAYVLRCRSTIKNAIRFYAYVNSLSTRGFNLVLGIEILTIDHFQ